MSGSRVVIIGGGLAGLSAAVRLAERGCEPVVIETRRKLGGRATSFVDPRSGEVLDNCQHVLMGCCTNLIDFYDKLGIAGAIEWHRRLFWRRVQSPPTNSQHSSAAILQAGLLPAPLHFLGAFARMRIYSANEKRAIGRGMWRLIRLGPAGRWQWRERTFATFLRECAQPEVVVRDFWNPIVVSACNLDVNRVSASAAMHVFQEGFLANKWSYTMGLATVPLWELYEPARDFIESRGGQVRLGESARSIAFDGRTVNGVITEHEFIKSSAVIAAVPFDRLDKLVSQPMREVDSRLQQLDKLVFSPILGVHLFFDRQVMPDELPHLVLVGDGLRGVQWLFNKGVGNGQSVVPQADPPWRTIGNGGGGVAQADCPLHHVHAVISAADAWMSLDEQAIVDRVLEDVCRALPHADGLAPIRARAVKEKRATFAPTPGSDRYRPSSAPGTIGLKGGGIANLFLAGDWTDTGWPATMEGAVRSGYAAAAAIAESSWAVPLEHDETPNTAHTGEVRSGIIEDVPPGRLAAMLGLR